MKVYLLAIATLCFAIQSDALFGNLGAILKAAKKFKNGVQTQISNKFKQGENVCAYKEEKDSYKWKQYKQHHCDHIRTKCNPDLPQVYCKERRCELTFVWKPVVYTKDVPIIECCPGYTTDEHDVNTARGKSILRSIGCTKFKTCLTISEYTPKRCSAQRLAELEAKRKLYKLTTPTAFEDIPTYPVTDSNLGDFLTFPILNMSARQIVGMAFANPIEQEWAGIYINMVAKNNKRSANQTKTLAPFTSYDNYTWLLDDYRTAQHDGSYADKFFRYPSQEQPFKDIIKDEAWKDDEVFIDQRLAGLNPMSIRKLGLEEFVNDPSKFNSDLDDAISEAAGVETTFIKMVEEELVYVLDYPLIRNLTNVADITDSNPGDRREMRSSRSPVAIFASVKNWLTDKYNLRAVGIQHDFDGSAPLVTPADGAKWLLAKQEIERADFAHAELIEHLLKTHLMMEPICVTMHRTLSSYHPLHAVLKWHCRGTFMTNGLGLPNLVKPEGIMHLLFSIGHVGSIEMLNKAFPDISWDETHFVKSLQKRGVDDTKTLPYFPYRDDGLIIWNNVKMFAKEYVNLYYKTKDYVKDDKELEDFVNELSADGTGEYGGQGMIKDFPKKIWTKGQLVDLLTRVIFLPLQHHAVNYPIAYYGAFVPNMPSKLYDDPRAQVDEFDFHRLPQSHVATLQVALAMNLGSLRYDTLFDYSKEMADLNARYVVLKYNKLLETKAQPTIKARNVKRFEEGHMTYPYFLFGLMPNSIHT